MAQNKNQDRPNQGPQRQGSQPDPRQDQPKWNDQHPQAPPRDQPGNVPEPQKRGSPSGISNRSMDEEQRQQDNLPDRGTRQSER